jgi:hypothetical protein
MEIPTRRRRLLSTVLALFLAIESVSAVAAAATVGRPGAAPAATGAAPAPARVVAAPRSPLGASARGIAAASVTRLSTLRTVEATDPVRLGAVRTSPAAIRVRSIAVQAARALPKAKSHSGGGSGSSKAKSGSGGHAAVSSGSLHGRNHFWFPGVGISRSVSWYACSRNTALANIVYRWGCGGRNNVYIMGHAYGVFAPLHRAYVSGRLRVGMKAYYADGRGKVHAYKVKWWKLTRPTTAASWAWASQSVPSMTLQTCVGSNSEYRLMVRLVEVR